MFTTNIDLGQLIIGGLIGLVGFLIKNEVSTLTARLNKHDAMIIGLVADVQRLIGKSMSDKESHWSHRRESDE